MAKKRRPSSKTKVPARAPVDGAREKIQAVAIRLFAEKGYHAVSIRDISSEAGLNISLVSYYFGGKEGLYTSILVEHMERKVPLITEILARFQAMPATRANFVEQIRAIVDLFVEMRLENPQLSILMQREHLDGLPLARRLYEDLTVPVADEIVAMIGRAQEKGLVRKDLNARSYFVALIQALFGFFLLHDCKLKIWKDAYRLPKQKKEFVDFLVRLYTEGVFA